MAHDRFRRTFKEKFGVHVVAPDTSFIEKHKENLLGIVITHAHEDHVGAVPLSME